MKPLTNIEVEETEDQQPKRVLLYVEDDEENRRVALLRLRKYFELLLAPNSREACRILSERADDIEAILMDIELKGSEMDGIMLTKVIRGSLTGVNLPVYAQSFKPLSTPILFVTAYGDRHPEQELINAGGNLLIRKPVDFLQLTMALTQIRLKHNQQEFEKRSARRSQPIEHNIQVPQKKIAKRIILYIEDDEKSREIADFRLKNAYDLIMASNDREACTALIQRGKELDAILMDIELQGSTLNGIDLAKIIRGRHTSDNLPMYARNIPKFDTPILFVTAYGDRYSEKELTRAGGSRVIRKPVDFVQLKMALTLIRLEKEERICVE